MAFTKVVGAGIHTLSNITSHNIHSSGIVTATGLDISGDATIGGVLTYEDVTSIDSVGLITARNGIDCNADLDVDGHTNLDNVSIAGVTTFSGDLNIAENIIHIGDTNTKISFPSNDTIQLKAASNTITAENLKSTFTRPIHVGDYIAHQTVDSIGVKFFNQGTGNNNTYIGLGAEDHGTSGGTFHRTFRVYRQGSSVNRVDIDNFGNLRAKQGFTVAGISTFSSNIDANGDLDVDGHTNLDNVSIVGVATVTGSNINIEGGSANNSQLKINSTGRYRGVQLDENGTRKAHFQHDATDHKTVVGTAEGTLQFNSGDIGRIILNSSGHWVPMLDSTYDLGLNAKRFRNVYADTLYGTGRNMTGIHTVSSSPNVSGQGAMCIGNAGSYRFIQSHGSQELKINPIGNGVWLPTNSYVEGSTRKVANISNNADNRVITGADTHGRLNAESKLTFDGNNLRIDQGDSVDGIVGEAYTNYFGLKHADQTLDSEYMILSNDDHTYISASSGYQVRIRAGGNDGTNELQIGSGNDALTWRGNKIFHAGNDGSGSGLDADTLDGVQGSSFLRSDAEDTTSGRLNLTSNGQYPITIDGDHDGKIVVKGSSNPYIRFQEGTTDKAYIQWHSSGKLILANQETNERLDISSGSNGLQFLVDGAAKTVWHSGNDGGGSGLDSDTVDGIQASSFLRSDANDTATGLLSLTNDSQYPLIINGDHNGKIALKGSSSPYIRFQESATNKAYIQWDSGAGEFIMVNQESGDYLRIGSGLSGLKYTADGSTATIWHSGNHGHGSGLNADTLDGIEGANLLRSDTSDIMSGTLTVNDVKISSGYHLQRSNHNSGHLEGSYNNVGGNAAKTNPIYTIGSNYNPGDAGLSDMYGIGFSKGSTTSFINLTGTANSWGMYVAADGDARVFLDGGTGNINAAGHLYCNRVYLDLQTSRYLSDATGNYGSIQINGSGNGTWEGYSIDGRVVFMHDGLSHAGIYNDVDNDWFIYCQRQGFVQLRHNDTPRIATTSYGVQVDTTILLNGGNLRRGNHHTGHLEGSYNNIGANSDKSNPIYTIGSSYNPTDAGLSNMYGIGYSHGNASFTPSGAGWGMYVAADGDARLYFDAGNGRVYFINHHTFLSRGSTNSIRIQTNNGYVDIGPMNSNYCHIQTDRVQFYFNKQLVVNGNIVPYVTGNNDLGATTNRWNNLYVNDLQLSNESKKEEGGNDVDGTWGNFTIQEGENDLYLINNRNGKKYKFNLTEVQ